MAVKVPLVIGLCLTRCAAMTFHSANSDMTECPCLQWSKVYGEGGIDCNPGIGGLAGGEFCSFMKNLHSNVCVENQFMVKTGLSDSICYVSAECAGKFPGKKGMTQKTCTAGKDTLLTGLPISATTGIAKTNGVDQGCMAAYSAIYVDKLYTEITEAEINVYRATGQPYFIWSMRNHLGPRLEIRGEEVYRHDFNPKTPGYWDVTCLEGCKT